MVFCGVCLDVLLIDCDSLWVDVCIFVKDQVLRLNKTGTSLHIEMSLMG